MAELPKNIDKYICSIKPEIVMAYLHIDEYGKLISWGGQPHKLGLEDLRVGQTITENLNFLEGMLPVSDILVLRFLSLCEEHCAHVHVIPDNLGIYVLLFDASSEYDPQQQMQQQINDIKLLNYQKNQLLQALDNQQNQLKQSCHKKVGIMTRIIQYLACICKKTV
ncbi:MAG: hypothetical protein DRR16_11095 [Candidatus Parabeggiatoa sp. nov. 3]|nr:MAG: hypothetical protein DRR00_16655 [Gammaproteobacteria bacterium]RKZ65348.1 MAG: hypothetical protein DRQ99_12935 [Gammaproteobacteria bacterium]RKZ85872.1 MAG: hypothetical protein DRR16_11095 [Gammaproteobacteria bacterium]